MSKSPNAHCFKNGFLVHHFSKTFSTIMLLAVSRDVLRGSKYALLAKESGKSSKSTILLETMISYEILPKDVTYERIQTCMEKLVKNS